MINEELEAIDVPLFAATNPEMAICSGMLGAVPAEPDRLMAVKAALLEIAGASAKLGLADSRKERLGKYALRAAAAAELRLVDVHRVFELLARSLCWEGGALLSRLCAVVASEWPGAAGASERTLRAGPTWAAPTAATIAALDKALRKRVATAVAEAAARKDAERACKLLADAAQRAWCLDQAIAEAIVALRAQLAATIEARQEDVALAA